MALLAAVVPARSADPSGRWYPSLPDEFKDADDELQLSIREHDAQCTSICAEQQFFCGEVAKVEVSRQQL